MLGTVASGAGYTVPSSVARIFRLSACWVRSARSCLLQVTDWASAGSPGSDTLVWSFSCWRVATLAASSAAGSALAAWYCAWASDMPWSEPATVNQIVRLPPAGTLTG